ncbi:MAG: CPBP family intramembrane metalloprotease [Planctomycetota bacterium]|nr:CPBP family intramembrane metalloprotease [Planctomycetota bacterium]
MNAPDPGKADPTGLRGLIGDILSLDRGALAILVAVPFMLTLLDYYGMPWHYPQQWGERRSQHADPGPRLPARELRRSPAPGSDLLKGIDFGSPEERRRTRGRPTTDSSIGEITPALEKWAWWGLCCLLFLVLIPAIVARLFAKQGFRDLGLKVRGTGKDAITYLALFAIFFPVIWLVSRDAAFQKTYPFFRTDGQGVTNELITFWIIYCLQFFAIEYFFRGFMVLGLKKSLGWASVLVMLAPYCMIHYYKPMPEALGAIGAGLVLGALSWRTGTILYGWALHFGVALSMDLLALHAKDLL